MIKKGPLAVVTMLYNESDLLPIWSRHYTNQVGSRNCFVLDHGSTDGATDELELNVLKLPRSPFNEVTRAESCSRFCASLLYYYERVLFTDVDEIVVADPAISPNLTDYVGRTDAPVLNCFGMDLIQDETTDAALRFDQPILRQRNWVLPSSVLCKPTFTSMPVTWSMGFHTCDAEVRFGDLYLFHLAYVDFGMIRRRQQKRNSVENLGPGSDHHRMDPDAFSHHIREGYVLARRVEVELGRSDPFVQDAISRMLDGCSTCEPARTLSSYRADALWRIPERFFGIVLKHGF